MYDISFYNHAEPTDKSWLATAVPFDSSLAGSVLENVVCTLVEKLMAKFSIEEKDEVKSDEASSCAR